MTKTLKGGTFNVLNSRDGETVKKEVTRLLNKHDLDFLCLQEAVGYFKEFNSIHGYEYIANRKTWGGKESTILVKSSLKHDRIKFFTYGDGWITMKGGQHAPTGQTQVRLDGWLYVRSLHLPTPSHWSNGRIASNTPGERKDDLIAAMKGLRGYFRLPARFNARLAAGDWNEPPTTTGEYSPRWLMAKTGAVGVAPSSKKGHGRIDWPIAKGARLSNVFKDLDIREGSDHEPVIFTVTKLTRRK